MNQELEILEDRKVIFRCDPVRVKQLKQIALDEDITLNSILLEAVDLVIEKRKKERPNKK